MGIVNLLSANMIIWEEDADLPRLRPLRCGGEAGDVSPGLEALPHLLTVCEGREPVAPRTEVRDNGAIGRKKALGCAGTSRHGVTA